MKWLLSVFLVLLAAGGVFLLTRFDEGGGPGGPGTALGEDGADGGLGRTELSQGTGAARTGSGAAGAQDTGARDPNGVRTARGPLVTSAAGGGSVEVLVLHPQGRGPISNADVWLLDREAVPAQALAEAGTSDRNLKRLVQDFGRQVKTDPEGVAVVPRVLDGVILARSSGYAKLHQWVGPLPSPLELVLMEEIDLQVAVVDGQGRPVPQVPVAICLDDPGLYRAILESTTVPPSGVANFKRVEQRLQPRTDGKGYVVGLGFPTGVRQTVPFDPSNLPDEPLQLVLPDAGRLLVHAVDDQGRPVDDRMVISLGRMVDPLDGTPPVFQPDVQRRTGDGFARFEWVEARSTVAVQFSGVQDLRDQVFEVQGPEAADATQEVTLTWDLRWPTLAGRAVNSVGQPLANRNGRIILRQDGVSRGGPPLVTDAQGNFRMILTTPWRVGSERLADLELFGTVGEAPEVCTLDLSFEPPPGETPFGDVVFQGKPLLAQGRVMSLGGAVNGAQVVAQQQTKNKEGALVWTPMPGIMCTSDENGEFSLFGEAPPNTPLQLMARRRGFQRGYFEDLSPGLRGVLIQLEEGDEDSSADKEGRGEAGKGDDRGGSGGRDR